MNLRRYFFAALTIAFTVVALAQQPIKKTDANGNAYTSYTNDPTDSRWYTLENGLTVMLGQNSS